MSATPTQPTAWYPTWLTQNYLIDAARYMAAGVPGQKK